ncbi:acrosin [Eleutherodactylus coqui]|uniref:acrosin n=1 Tax=Eleutherodactylus coqui TaxID=57060 RepID=UPI0034631AAE
MDSQHTGTLSHVDTWRLVFGANKLSVLTPEMQIRGISKVIEHEAYYNEKLSNDVALLALDRPITYNNYIQPACLPQKTVDIKRMTDCFIAGWGLLEQNAYESSDTLQEARVQQISTKLCNSTFWYNGLVGIYNLCAGNEKGGVDACQGDSGGPLVCKEPKNKVFSLVGVTSWGSGCGEAQSPGLYSSTQYFLKWILDKIEPRPMTTMHIGFMSMNFESSLQLSSLHAVLIPMINVYSLEDCGKRPLVAEFGSSRIVGGVDSQPGAWPWLVSIQVPTRTGHRHSCGGTLLNKLWVLTAAHCFKSSKRSAPNWKIILGGHQLSAVSQDAQIRSIKSYVEHENYDPRIEANDVALIELNSSVKYNDHVQPACLPTATMNITVFHPCYISGWGVMAEKSAETADILQEAKVNQVDLKRCNSSKWYNGRIWKYNLCAGYEEGRIDSCQGDSGGPLMCRDEDTYKYYVTGVTSWGSGCAQSQKPGVYTNTQYFLKWIQQKLAAVVPSPIPKEENILPTWKIVPSNRKPQPNPFTKKPVKPTHQPPCHSHPKQITSSKH